MAFVKYIKDFSLLRASVFGAGVSSPFSARFTHAFKAVFGMFVIS